MTVCRFDESLPRLVAALSASLSPAAIELGVVFRDATGALSFFLGEPLADPEVDRLTESVRSALGVYARADGVVVPVDAPGAARIRLEANDHAQRVHIPLAAGEPTVRYLERRIVGADWLRRPAPVRPSGGATGAARLAFTSLKGGVGRSTALTVVAAELARDGRNILVVDLDVEAPGIGSLLLSEGRLPQFGVIDYLVERNVGELAHAFVDQMIGTSSLTQGQGLVSVVPAVGLKGSADPQNYLSKLSRAMMEADGPDGSVLGLADKLAEMLVALESVRSYDLVLLDVRAGLAEIAAGPLLSLGAEVLIFATNQRQTLEDLRYLLANLGNLTAASVQTTDSPWERLKVVHAKAALTASAKQFADHIWELFVEFLYVESLGLEEFNFGPEDPDAPHTPIVIPLDNAFADWDPVTEPNKILATYYERTFHDLIEYVRALLPANPAQNDVEVGDAEA